MYMITNETCEAMQSVDNASKPQWDNVGSIVAEICDMTSELAFMVTGINGYLVGASMPDVPKVDATNLVDQLLWIRSTLREYLNYMQDIASILVL